MLLDPLADKLMVTAAYIILVAYTPKIVPPWIAVIIIGREFLVSGLRSIAASEGFTIEASEIGKLKTVIQIVSVVAAILAHRWNYWDWGGFIIAVHMIAVWAICVDDDCVDHLGDGLLCRLLEEDRPRQRTRAHAAQFCAEPAQGQEAGRSRQTALPGFLGPERARPAVCSARIALWSVAGWPAMGVVRSFIVVWHVNAHSETISMRDLSSLRPQESLT